MFEVPFETIHKPEEKIKYGDLVKSKTNFKYGVVIVIFKECCGVRFNNSDEVTIIMFDGLEKVKK